jgi:hypothetical protein
MRGRSGGRPTLDDAVVFSVHSAVAETLALSGNGSKWRPMGRGLSLYNRDPTLQRAAVPRGLSSTVYSEPMVWHPQWIYCPTALSGLTATFAVTASSVRESAFAGLLAMLRLTWTHYALL